MVADLSPRRETLRRCPDSGDGRVHRSRAIAHHGVVHRADDGVDEARLVGTTLAWAAFGLLPFAFVMLQLRVFYAMRDARTPTPREHLHGAGGDHPGSAGARGALRGRSGDRAERLHVPVLHHSAPYSAMCCSPGDSAGWDFARWPGPSAGSRSQLLSPAQSHGAASTSRT